MDCHYGDFFFFFFFICVGETVILITLSLIWGGIQYEGGLHIIKLSMSIIRACSDQCSAYVEGGRNIGMNDRLKML